jgi:hypothetical protein
MNRVVHAKPVEIRCQAPPKGMPARPSHSCTPKHLFTFEFGIANPERVASPRCLRRSGQLDMKLGMTPLNNFRIARRPEVN